MKKLICELQPPGDKGDYRRHACSLTLVDEAGGSSEIPPLYYEVEKSVPPLEEGDVEPFVIALYLFAMQEAADIHIDGNISYELLSNLAEFGLAWHRWRPETYAQVSIHPTFVDDIYGPPVRPGNLAVAAFSGGVDATFAAWSNYTDRRDNYRCKLIRDYALVQGFDIGLGDDNKFNDAYEKGVLTLRQVDGRLHRIRTNFRQVIPVIWEDVFATALVSCLQFMKPLASNAIIGSAEPYEALTLPWGSSPVTDPLLSSSRCRIMHDGAGWSRSEKVARIAEWDTGSANLRVCWQAKNRRGNCGACEKCIRTMMNFEANGLPVPSAFGRPRVTREIAETIYIANDAIYVEFDLLLKLARRNQLQADWVPVVAAKLRRYQRVAAIKQFVKRLLKSFRTKDH